MTAYVDAWRDYRWRCCLFGATVVGALLLAPWSQISRAIGVLGMHPRLRAPDVLALPPMRGAILRSGKHTYG